MEILPLHGQKILLKNINNSAPIFYVVGVVNTANIIVNITQSQNSHNISTFIVIVLILFIVTNDSYFCIGSDISIDNMIRC